MARIGRPRLPESTFAVAYAALASGATRKEAAGLAGVSVQTLRRRLVNANVVVLRDLQRKAAVPRVRGGRRGPPRLPDSKLAVAYGALARGATRAEGAGLAGVSRNTLLRRLRGERVVVLRDRKHRATALSLED